MTASYRSSRVHIRGPESKQSKSAILYAQDQGVCEIARQLGRAASTISRELRRNAARRSGGPITAPLPPNGMRIDQRPKPAKLATNSRLRQYVQERLSGEISSGDGSKISGPKVEWKGRKKGPRQSRRWARA